MSFIPLELTCTYLKYVHTSNDLEKLRKIYDNIYLSKHISSEIDKLQYFKNLKEINNSINKLKYYERICYHGLQMRDDYFNFSDFVLKLSGSVIQDRILEVEYHGSRRYPSVCALRNDLLINYVE